MNTDDQHATLSDWIVCDLPDGRRFLAGKVMNDPRKPDREGAYITTSLLLTPVEALADGSVVETHDNRYRLVDRYRADDALFAKLNAWMDARPTRPTLGAVLATQDSELIAAYVLRAFREAAAKAVWSGRTES